MWGFSKGCERSSEATLEDVEQFASEAKEMKLAGLAMWSLNRGVQFNGGSSNCTTVDVAPDGSYLNAIRKGWQ